MEINIFRKITDSYVVLLLRGYTTMYKQKNEISNIYNCKWRRGYRIIILRINIVL
jgi:hypothetical protein